MEPGTARLNAQQYQEYFKLSGGNGQGVLLMTRSTFLLGRQLRSSNREGSNLAISNVSLITMLWDSLSWALGSRVSNLASGFLLSSRWFLFLSPAL